MFAQYNRSLPIPLLACDETPDIISKGGLRETGPGTFRIEPPPPAIKLRSRTVNEKVSIKIEDELKNKQSEQSTKLLT